MVGGIRAVNFNLRDICAVVQGIFVAFDNAIEQLGSQCLQLPRRAIPY